MPKTTLQKTRYPTRYLLLKSMISEAKEANHKEHEDLARILGRKAAEETAAACFREALELLERHFGGDECLMSLTRSLTGRRS